MQQNIFLDKSRHWRKFEEKVLTWAKSDLLQEILRMINMPQKATYLQITADEPAQNNYRHTTHVIDTSEQPGLGTRRKTDTALAS